MENFELFMGLWRIYRIGGFILINHAALDESICLMKILYIKKIILALKVADY